VPPTAPCPVSQIPPTPPGNQITIDRTTLGELEHSCPSISASRVDPQNLDNTWIRIEAKRRVPHTECSVLASQLFEPFRDVHVASGCAIASLQNLVLPFVSLAVAIVPATVPSAVSPIPSIPASKPSTIYALSLHDALPICPSISASRVDPQNLDNTWIRIEAKRRVPHTECSVLASQLFEPFR